MNSRPNWKKFSNNSLLRDNILRWKFSNNNFPSGDDIEKGAKGFIPCTFFFFLKKIFVYLRNIRRFTKGS